MSDQPNLLLCCFDLIPGPSGLSRRITEYLKGMSEKFQVVVLSAKTPDVSHIERFSGARLLRVPVGSGDLASRIQAFDRAVRRQMESEEFAIVHCFDPFGGYALCELKNDYGYRFIYDASSFPSQELRWSQPDTENDRRFLARIRRQELYCLMNADAVITGSEATRRYIAGLGVSTEAISVVPAPVDLTPYTPETMGRPDASPMKLVYLGSQLGYQGLTTLLRAMQLALRQTDVRLTIVGARHPEWQPPLEDLIEELKLKGKVEFQPPVTHDDVHKIIALADAGVVPLDPVERNTVQGGALAKVAEYLAGGRPVIASDLEVTRELVPEGAGTFFPPGDYKALAEVLVSLGTHPEQRVAMGAVAAQEARRRFDGAKARTRLLEIYGTLQLAASQQVDDRGEPTRSAIKALKALAAEKDRAGAASPAAKPKTDEKKPKTDEKKPKSEEKKARAEEKRPEPPPDDRATTAITDPASSGKIEPPVVMGLPLREEASERPVIIGQELLSDEAPPGATAPNLSPVGPRPSPARAPAPVGASPPSPSATLPRPPIPMGSQPRAPNPVGSGPQSPTGNQARVLAQTQPMPASIPMGSQARAQNPLAAASPLRASSPQMSPPPIPMGSQARAPNPLFNTAPVPGGSQARAPNPLLGTAPAPSTGSQARLAVPVGPVPAIPTASQARARNPLGSPGILSPSGSQPRPRAAATEDLQPGSSDVQTDKRMALGSRALAASTPDDDEPEEVSDDAVVPLTDTQDEDEDGIEEAEAEEVPPDDPATTLGSADEEPPEAEAEAELEHESHDLEPVGALDPWLAQLVHGWCPPDSGLFTRHAPPTTFPGRENPPPASRP